MKERQQLLAGKIFSSGGGRASPTQGGFTGWLGRQNPVDIGTSKNAAEGSGKGDCVIYGEKKSAMFHSQAWADGLAARQGSAVTALPAGDWVMTDAPEAFNRTVLAWLSA
jgi:hypothetical protein